MNKKKLIPLAILMIAFMGQASATVTSCDSLSYSSEGSEFFDGELLSCSMTSDFSTDEINIDIPSSELSSQFPGGETSNSVGVKVTQQENYAKYGFRDTGLDPVYKLEYASQDVDTICSNSQEQKLTTVRQEIKGDVYDLDGTGDLSTSDWYGKERLTWTGCYVEAGYIQKGEKLASVGEISSSPSLVWSTDWEISNGEQTYTKTISNGDIGELETTTVANGLVKIQWTGSKTGGDVAPSPTDEMIAHNNEWSNNGFRVINSRDYQTYTGNIPDLIYKVEKRVKGEIATDDAVVSAINQDAIESVEAHSSSEFTDATVTGSSLETGALELSMPNIRFPAFQIYMDVCQYVSGDSACEDFITVKKSVGIPEINDVSSTRFKEMGSGQITVDLQNVGDARGTFSTRVLNCGDGFTISDNSQRSLLGAGDSTTQTFQISASSQSFTSKELTGSCDVQVKEINSGKSDSASVSVTAVQQNECDPGDQFIKVKENENGQTYDTVQECSTDGLRTEQILKCSPEEKAIEEDNTWQCKQQGDDVNVWMKEDGQCNKETYTLKNVPDEAFTSKASCQDSLQNAQYCLVNENVAGQKVQFGCVDKDIVDKGKYVIVLILAIIGASFGLQVGRNLEGERKIQGKFRPRKNRSVSRFKRGRQGSWSKTELAGIGIGFLLGAGVGWYLGYWAVLVAIGLGIAKIYIPGY